MANEKVIWDYFKGKGLNDFGVAGLMGNLYAESGLLPNNLQNTGNKKLGMTDDEYVAAVDNGSYQNFVKDSQGFGLAQWTYWSRKQNLLNFARAAGKSIGDLQMQLDFLWKELSESYSSVLQTLKTASSILAASNAVLLKFERPADQSETVQKKRAGFGETYYNKFAGSSVQEPKEANNMTAVERLLQTARNEIGYLEKATNSNLDDKTANAGSNNYTKYARDLDKLGVYNFPKNGYAWCDMFVDWCFVTTFGVETAWKMTNQPMGGCGAGCTYSAQYYKNMGRFFTSNPQPGDQIFFKDGSGMGHTGLVEKVQNGRVYTIEGNTSSLAGVVPNGGAVRDKSYSLSYSGIGGYGRPDWSLVENMNIEEDENMDVTRFTELWNEMRKGLQDNDAGQYSAEARQWAVNSGLIAGNGTSINGEPNCMWQDMLTREQFVTVLYRFAQMMGKAA